MLETILIIMGMAVSFFSGCAAVSYSLLNDKRFVKLKEYEVLIHKNDLSLLVAGAPRELKIRLSKMKLYDEVRLSAEKDLMDDDI